LTEYHEDLERCFVDGEEMLCFSGIDDFEEKVSFLLSNPERAKNIALNGYNRFMKDHESKVVLTKLLEELFNER
jgi:spore maturation protein CgeB